MEKDMERSHKKEVMEAITMGDEHNKEIIGNAGVTCIR
jgi:hypothetical protein